MPPGQRSEALGIVPFADLVSRHARREARREKIGLDVMEDTYLDPDHIRPSDHDDAREIRSRYLGEEQIELVVDVIDGRIVTVWRRSPMR